VTPSLETMLETTRDRVRELRPAQGALEDAVRRVPPPPSWTGAFGGPDLAVIAEIKRRSPSAGLIAPELDPGRRAGEYVRGGARAISVLTDGPFFGGSLDDLRTVRANVGVPLLRKDFIIDPVQVYESRAAGASAVLLIVRALPPELLRELSALARDIGLARLVEVHARAELDVALDTAPEAIGVNSRDLDDFAVRLEAVRPILRAVPRGVVAVAESGISVRADVERVAAWGADAILVGTALAGTQQPARAVRQLVGVPRAPDAREEGPRSDG
jgi:indole-3-glycerol phosphate synthase